MRDVAERGCVEKEKERFSVNLNKRVEELNCLYLVEEVMEKKGIEIGKALKQIVKLISRSWRHSDKTGCRVIFEGREYATGNFREMGWILRENISSGIEEGGLVEICFLEKRTEDPFLKEERSLLASIANLLEAFIERRRTEEAFEERIRALAVSEKRIGDFLHRLLSEREKERNHLSASLHGEIGSMTIALDSRLSIAEEDISQDDKQGALESVGIARRDLRNAVDKLKRIIRNLRPFNLEIIGLPVALEAYCSDVAQNTGIEFDVQCSINAADLDVKSEVVLYQLVQEALNNVVKHARASSVRVNLRGSGDGVKLDVIDNGRGFDVSAFDGGRSLGMGIQGMKERVESLGGVFSISSSPETGTRIIARLPVERATAPRVQDCDVRS